MSIHKFIVPVLRRNEHGNWCLCFQSVPLPDYCCAVKHTHTHTTSTDNARTVRTREKFPAVLFICFFVFVNQMSHLALNSCSINKFYWMVSSLILSRMRALIMCVWECGEWICSRNINDGRRIVNSVRLQLHSFGTNYPDIRRIYDTLRNGLQFRVYVSCSGDGAYDSAVVGDDGRAVSAFFMWWENETFKINMMNWELTGFYSQITHISLSIFVLCSCCLDRQN